MGQVGFGFPYPSRHMLFDGLVKGELLGIDMLGSLKLNNDFKNFATHKTWQSITIKDTFIICYLASH